MAPSAIYAELLAIREDARATVDKCDKLLAAVRSAKPEKKAKSTRPEKSRSGVDHEKLKIGFLKTLYK